MSDWDQYFEAEVIRILESGEFDLREPHHFVDLSGCPYVTAYQLAVAFERDNRELCRDQRKVIGEGEGMENLSAYIARQLSQKILDSEGDYSVEAIWLSAEGLPHVVYHHAGENTSANPNSKHHGYSLFRLRQINSQ